MVINKPFFAWLAFVLVCCSIVLYFVFQGKASIKQMDLEQAKLAAEERETARVAAEKAQAEYSARTNKRSKQAQERRVAVEAASAQVKSERAAAADRRAKEVEQAKLAADCKRHRAAFGEVKRQFLTNQTLLAEAAGMGTSAEFRLLTVYCATEAALTNKRGLIILFEKADQGQKVEELQAELQEQRLELDKLQAQIDAWTLAQVAQLKIEIQLACQCILQKRRQVAAAAWARQQTPRRLNRKRPPLESGRLDRLERHKAPKS